MLAERKKREATMNNTSKVKLLHARAQVGEDPPKSRFDCTKADVLKKHRKSGISDENYLALLKYIQNLT